MLEKKTLLDQIEIIGTDCVQVRLALVVADGGEELVRKYHRTAFARESDMAAQWLAVNQHLADLGQQPVGEADMARVNAFAALAFT